MVEYSKYYLINLYKKNYCIQLFENKELQLGEYTPSDDFKRFYVNELIEAEEQISFSNSKIKVLYNYFSPRFIECRSANNFFNDGFYYDLDKKIVLYGKTRIYAYKRGNSFYEVITGIEIPDMEMDAHSIEEVKYAKGFQDMANDLFCVQGHFDLYKTIVKDVFDKLSVSYRNYVQACNEYLEKEQIYLDLFRRQNILEKLHRDLWRLESEKDVLSLERENVKKLISNIQKSSL